MTTPARRPRGRGQNRRAIARPPASSRPRAVVKTQRRPRHAGGRPPLFIPIAVVARAVELARSGSDFSTVVRKLEAEGNGAWPRKTLMRRVASTSSSSTPARGQNRRRRQPPGGSSSAQRDVAKTRTWDELIDAVHAADDGTPELNEAIAALHAAPEYGRGRCHCDACRRARAAA